MSDDLAMKARARCVEEFFDELLAQSRGQRRRRVTRMRERIKTGDRIGFEAMGRELKMDSEQLEQRFAAIAANHGFAKAGRVQ